MKAKILVISDSHQDSRTVNEVIERESPFDILVHCGDIEGSLYPVEHKDNPFLIYAVLGNCDSYGYPQEILFKVGVYNIFVCHGHRYMVHNSLSSILEAGKSKFADIILYGHTHVPEIVEKKGILLVNPGSISLPKSPSWERSYAILKISDDFLPEAEIRHLDNIRVVSPSLQPSDRMIKTIMSDIDKGITAQKISKKHGIPTEMAERICRMYLTHPGITVDGILNRITGN